MATYQRLTPEETLVSLGENIKQFRIQRGLMQTQLAERAGIGISSLSHLENGHGSTLLSFVRVLRALGLEDGLDKLVPGNVFDPLSLNRQAAPRQRAKYTKTKKPTKAISEQNDGDPQTGK